MRFRLPYKKLNKLIEDETFEPKLNWGLRLATAFTVPLLWGLATGELVAAEWIALTAECISWVELRGSSSLRLRVLTGGALLALVFSVLGSLTGTSIVMSAAAMLFVGYVSGLFKNLGDRGSGLAICVFVLFITSNASPTHDLQALRDRCVYVLTGGIWNTVIGIAASSFIPQQQPYRRSIALIWKSISPLTAAVSKGLDGKTGRSSLRNIYLREKEVRTVIDNSLHFFEQMAHQVSNKNSIQYSLAQTRKATALVAAHVIAMSDELESLNFNLTENNIKLKLYALFRAMEQTMERMAAYTLTLKSEEELLLSSRIKRVYKLIGLLNSAVPEENSHDRKIIIRITQLADRSMKLTEGCIKRLEQLGTELPVYRSYSLLKTIYVLHPRHFVRNVRLLLSTNSLMNRYAIRTALASALALALFKWFGIEHGYWIPFTVIIVIQPYFMATFTKARDRILGTVLGVTAGSLLVGLPSYAKLMLLFACSVLMVWFLRRRYSVAAFFMTVSLVLLFAVEDAVDASLLLTRALSTLAGAGLAVIAGFALLPAWDSRYLPHYLSEALKANYEYFRTTFYNTHKEQNWTKCKRHAETRNSNLFDSFSRYIQEPLAKRKLLSLYYQIITANVRLTREMNNIQLEEESKTQDMKDLPATEGQIRKIATALQLWNGCLQALQSKTADALTSVISTGEIPAVPSKLSAQQENYLDKMTIELKAMHSELMQLASEED